MNIDEILKIANVANFGPGAPVSIIETRFPFEYFINSIINSVFCDLKQSDRDTLLLNNIPKRKVISSYCRA